MRMVLAGMITAVLAGCGDSDSTAPLSPPAADPAITGEANPALRDALDRIVPALRASPAAAAFGSALADGVMHRSESSIIAIEATLQRLTAEQPDAAVEADAIRLALMTRP